MSLFWGAVGIGTSDMFCNLEEKLPRRGCAGSMHAFFFSSGVDSEPPGNLLLCEG